MTDKETLAQWMLQHGYATGHGDTIEDMLVELDIQIVENWTRVLVNSVQGEREAILKIARNCQHNTYVIETNPPIAMGVSRIIDAIRARGQG